MNAIDKNGNKDWLYSMECPQCGQHEHFIIDCWQTMQVYDDGLCSIGDEPNFDEENFCRCPECDCEGTVGEFKIA